MPSVDLTGEPPQGLYADDLALARACAAGDEAAWERFVGEYRPILRRAADAIDPSGGARDIADGLFGELFGVRERDGVRKSLFDYYQGRSRLSTWLRAVLAQRFVDRTRELKRTEPLPDSDAEWPMAAPASRDAERDRFVTVTRAALAVAIRALPPRDRLRLRSYYIENLTLAEIGRLLREHEATVSRHLTRARRELGAAVEAQLTRDHGFDARTLAECFDAVRSDPGTIDLQELMAEEEPARTRPKIVQTKRSL